jgi:2,5-diketo-D-gluconate reductase A
MLPASCAAARSRPLKLRTAHFKGGTDVHSHNLAHLHTVKGMDMELTLNNGVTMPALGLGVFQSAPEQTTAAVEAALATGYRHIDTAAAYGNEREVGEGIRRSGLDRAEVFIETKVWVSDYGYDQTLHAWDKATGKLCVDSLDLLILHQPAPDRFEKTVAAYKALETLLADGRVRAIGVSNFMPHHLDQLLESTDVVPAVNQIELHPYFTQSDVQAADARHGILTQAWSPIGGITFYPGWGGQERRNVMEDPAIATIAQTHGKSPAQAMLRWHLQQGRSAIPKSTNPARIAENFDVFDFELSTDELAAIDALDTGNRNGPDPDQARPERFAMVIPEA